ncbi:MAG: hypothetical protein KDB62_01690 [Solirubrobacterales bacterium]|nr:hypothetical protein [Solirubrobacterales bacterium]
MGDEFELTLDDGSQTDVQRDRGFNVVGDRTDNESESGEGNQVRLSNRG